MILPRWPHRLRRGQRGVDFIVDSLVPVPLIAFAGPALDLSLLFDTRAGIDAAAANAASAAAANQFRFFKPKALTWSASARRFGTDPDGATWTAAGAVADGQWPTSTCA